MSEFKYGDALTASFNEAKSLLMKGTNEDKDNFSSRYERVISALQNYDPNAANNDQREDISILITSYIGKFGEVSGKLKPLVVFKGFERTLKFATSLITIEMPTIEGMLSPSTFENKIRRNIKILQDFFLSTMKELRSEILSLIEELSQLPSNWESNIRSTINLIERSYQELTNYLMTQDISYLKADDVDNFISSLELCYLYLEEVNKNLFSNLKFRTAFTGFKREYLQTLKDLNKSLGLK